MSPKFELGRDFCTIPYPKFHHPMFTCSEVIELTNKQTNKHTQENKQTPLKTSNALRYATTLRKQIRVSWKSQPIFVDEKFGIFSSDEKFGQPNISVTRVILLNAKGRPTKSSDFMARLSSALHSLHHYLHHDMRQFDVQVLRPCQTITINIVRFYRPIFSADNIFRLSWHISDRNVGIGRWKRR